jgi:hypothetical protein
LHYNEFSGGSSFSTSSCCPPNLQPRHVIRGACKPPVKPVNTCPTCNTRISCPPAVELTTDCILVNSVVCTKTVQKVAELTLPAVTIGDIITVGPGGVITPLIQLVPDVTNIVSNVIVIRDKVINTGFLPANIVIAGITLPVSVNLPFQNETDCPGACPEDTVTETPFQVEAIVVQGIEALGISVATIRLKVVLRTTLTVTRPLLAKIPNNLKIIQDVNPNRCANSNITLNTSRPAPVVPPAP